MCKIKKGRAIYRRHFYYVPTTGEKSIDRRIKHCNRMNFQLNGNKCGIKKIHQITDVGKPGLTQDDGECMSVALRARVG